MTITIPPIKLLSRREVAALLQISYDSVATRACGTECLMEIRDAKKVYFNPAQVVAHMEARVTYGKCEGRCKAALTAAKPLQFKKSA